MNTETPKFTKNEFNQIKYIIYFAVFIVVFQAFQYLTTKNTTEKYKQLFSKTTGLAIITNSVSIESTTIQRTLLNITFSKDSIKRNYLLNDLSASEQKNKNGMLLVEEKIKEYDLYSFEKINLFTHLKLIQQQYKNCYDAYLLKLDKISSDDALLLRRNKLRPLLESFQKKQNLFLIRVFTDQQIAIEGIAADAGRMSFTLLIAGNFLLVIIILFLVYILFSERKNK